jgi:hypothetical protein
MRNPSFRFLRSVVWWLVFFAGMVIIALAGQAIFGKSTDGASVFCGLAGALWGSLLVSIGSNR